VHLAAAGSDARRAKASTSLPTSSRRAAPQEDIHGLDQADSAIQLTLQRQDDELEHISLHVEQIKGVSHSIHEELEMQVRCHPSNLGSPSAVSQGGHCRASFRLQHTAPYVLHHS
jgi:hypothetical protein